MTIFVITAKDLARVWSDRRAVLVNLGLPLLLTFIMGVSFGGGLFGRTGISAIPVAFVADGLPGPLRERVAEALEETDVFAVSWTDSATARAWVEEGGVAAAVVLPAGALGDYLRGEPVAVGVWKDPGSQLKADIVEKVLERMLARGQGGEAAYRALWPADEEALDAGPGGLSWEEFLAGGWADVWRRWRDLQGDPALAAAGERLLGLVDHQTALAAALENELVDLGVDDVSLVGDGQAGQTNLFDYFLPGFAVFFLMFGVSAGAREWHREKAAGTLQRQLLAPVSSFHLVGARWLSATVQGVTQLLGLLLAGAVLFGVNLGPDPWSLALVVLTCSTAAAGLFLLLALISRDEKIMGNLSTTVILISAMIGGNMMPLDAMPDWVHGVGRWVFNYWANRGFQDVIAHDRSVAQAPTPVLVLAAISLGLAALVALVHLRQRRGGGV